MSTETTTYVVRTKYEVDGAKQAAAEVAGIGKAADRSARSGGALKATLLGVFGAAGGVGAIMMAKKSLIDFNSTLETNKSTMAGLLMMNKGGTFEEQFEKASTLVDRFVVRAKDTSATMAELSQMGQLVTASVSAAGGSMKDLEDITVGATVAGKALGREIGDAGREIGQMIGGRLGADDVFGKQLARSVGFADHLKFNELSEAKRFQLTRQALNQPALKAMAKAQSESFSGLMSTFEDNLQIALAKVGLPLMKEITGEVKKWNEWIDQHPEKIAELVKDVGQGLATGFKAVKDAVMWISDNREVLMSLAKAALLMKGGSLLGDVAGAPLRALSSLHESMTMASSSAKGFAGAMGNAAGRMAQLGNIIGVVGAGASLIADAVLSRREKQLASTASADSTVEFFAGLATGKKRTPGAAGMRSRVEDAMEAGVLKRKSGGGFEVDRHRFLQGMQGGSIQRLVEGSGVKNREGQIMLASQIKLAAETELLRQAMNVATEGYRTAIEKGAMAFLSLAIERGKQAQEIVRSSAKSPGTTIKIAKVEVAAKDPDRWIQTLETETRKRARVPRRARAAMRGGGA